MRYLFLLLSFVVVGLYAVAQKPVVTRGEDGRVVKSQHDVYNIANQLAVRIEYTYDSIGLVRYRTLTSFDKKGRIVCREQYNAFDYLLLEDVFKYDRRGNLKRRNTTTIEETGETHRSEETRKYKYNKDTIVYRAYYRDGKLDYENPPKVEASKTVDSVKTETPEVKPAVIDSVSVAPAVNDSVATPSNAKQKNKSRKKK